MLRDSHHLNGSGQKIDGMEPEIDRIKKRLQELEEAIAETRRRLPAHSVKPPVMMDLLALEDERDLLRQSLEKK